MWVYLNIWFITQSHFIDCLFFLRMDFWMVSQTLWILGWGNAVLCSSSRVFFSLFKKKMFLTELNIFFSGPLFFRIPLLPSAFMRYSNFPLRTQGILYIFFIGASTNFVSASWDASYRWKLWKENLLAWLLLSHPSYTHSSIGRLLLFTSQYIQVVAVVLSSRFNNSFSVEGIPVWLESNVKVAYISCCTYEIVK